MKHFKNKKGFTLIELMVVIVIIGILASLAIPKFLGASNKAKISEFKPVLKQAIVLYSAYYQEHNTYVTSVGNITAGNNDIGFDLPEGESRFEYSSQESPEGVIVFAKLKTNMGKYQAGAGADLNQSMQKNTVLKDISW